MKYLALRLNFVPVMALFVVSLGCGNSGRQLQSVTISPANADAQNYPNGQVPFTATGSFSAPPSPQPLGSSDITWCVGSSTGACSGNTNPGASITQSGVAQCNPGFAGTVTILAGKTILPTNPDIGPQLSIFGAAQLTCP